MKTLSQKLAPNGPKKILALDGGGIRGALSLGYLKHVEDILRKQHNNPKLLLSDYFDMIGGTSTGSIIATLLALGWEVDDIKDMYFKLGKKIFGKKYKWWKIFEIDDAFKAKYDHAALVEQLQNILGDTKLGDQEKIRTALVIVAKRADTNSVWPLNNHPKGKFYDSGHGNNKDIPLWQCVRASAAAPTYFLPQSIEVGGENGFAAFVDGGVSMANNPALQMLMVATLKGFPYHWPMGEDNILLVSIGTGMTRWKKMPKQITKSHLLNWAANLPDMFMQDASWQNQQVLQWMSNSPTAFEIDAEVTALGDDILSDEPGRKKGLISYLRYNLFIDTKDLNERFKPSKPFTEADVESLSAMDNAENCQQLYDLGFKAGEQEVRAVHFPAGFMV
ncbi:patatin-like phospholipase/acyl hydrolase [Algoriphagus boseongensis]|uniref:Patatin-like phospholipase/acyl hydrolase n=1 Tax=Algoriphagus boseongensis TaxID=1442587 RepID=A0A4V3D2G9_9BACT|nr:patatin-like phospholipase family protein [Algoriphagus boseongensis]TDQ18937.1 patatin-like phospholipase/acyl hydrolase [Algoriphagus boseongensis]